jgi:3-deoxy-D-manno-octulosonate 8-phosphate phosphatase (KDO 8-P phosphatase)
MLESRQMSKLRAKKIKLLLFDVDGVMTDGKLFFIPAPPAMPSKPQGPNTSSMIEFKGFHAHDGVAISLARLAGIKTGLITKRMSETVAIRARDLKLDYIYQGIQDKGTAFQEIVRKEGISASEAAFVGDDVVDLPAMRASGFAVAVANARAEVKQEAHYVTPHAGGEGGVRDALEYVLKAQGRLKKIVELYIGGRSPKDDPGN